MTPLLVAFSPWLAGALLGAIIAGVLNRHQPTWDYAVVHCVGASFVGAGVASWFFGPVTVASATIAMVHVFVFWYTVPTLFGSVAALIATRRRR